jgi:hypothetical protein
MNERQEHLKRAALHLRQAMGMGDFPQDYYYAQHPAQGLLPDAGNRLGIPGGPITPPVVESLEQLSPADLQIEIARLLRNLPYGIIHESRYQLIEQPREALPFLQGPTAGGVSVAAAGNSTIATFTTPQGYAGFLDEIMLTTEPANAMASIKWSLQIGSTLIPSFAQQQFPQAVNGLRIPIKAEIVQNTAISLIANNTAGAPITVGGYIKGWFEPLDNSKEWGTSPKSGV